MKLAGFLLLLAGWMIALAAVVLLGSAASRAGQTGLTGLTGFVLAGLGVEALGLVLVARSHLLRRGEGR